MCPHWTFHSPKAQQSPLPLCFYPGPACLYISCVLGRRHSPDGPSLAIVRDYLESVWAQDPRCCLGCVHSPAPPNDQTSSALPGLKAHVSTFPAGSVPQSTSTDLTADSILCQAVRLIPKRKCRIDHPWQRGKERSQVAQSSRGSPPAMLSSAHACSSQGDSPGSNVDRGGGV